MNIALTRSRLEALIQTIRNRSIGVIGDFALDGYWHADMARSELSRETPLYSRPVVQESYSLGGSANVAWNLADLEAREVWAFSVTGQDWRGHLMRNLLEDEGIRIEALQSQADRVTPLFGKVVLHAIGRCNQEDARVDFINTVPLSAEMEAALLERLAKMLPNLDALIVADYHEQGIMTPVVTAGLLALAQQYPRIPIVVDSRNRAESFRSLILKPNEIEAARLFFPDKDPACVSLEALTQAALMHQAATGKPVFITLGADGCLVCDAGRCEQSPSVPTAPPVDTVGAGDAFIAALTAALAAQASPLEAALFANLVASITVKKLGITGTASPAELLVQYDRWIEKVEG